MWVSFIKYSFKILDDLLLDVLTVTPTADKLTLNPLFNLQIQKAHLQINHMHLYW